MQAVPAVWGVIFLVGFAASHLALQNNMVAESNLWWAWLILLVVSFITMGKSMKKQTSKPMAGVWMLSVVIAAVLTLGYLLGGFRFDGSQIMAV